MHLKQPFFFEVFSGVFLIVLFLSLPVYANPMPLQHGVYGNIGLELYYFIPTIIIEYLIIKKMLKGFSKYEIVDAVIIIHFFSYPITIIGGFYISYLMEFITFAIESSFYIFRFRRFDPKKVDMVIPSRNQIRGACFIANLATFIIGIVMTALFFNNTNTPPHFVIERQQYKARMDIATLETVLKLYKLDTGAYPSAEQGLRALVERPANDEKWRQGGYLEKQTIPKDPWGNAYVYNPEDKQYDFIIVSYGADGKPGGEGIDSDIDNRQED